MAEIAERGARAGSVSVRTEDWPAQATDAIVRTVEAVRDRTTGPALTIARAIVYGLLAAIVGVAAVILLTVFGVRLLDAYLPDSVFGESHVWAAYLLLGGLCTAVGAVLMVLARRRPQPEE